MTRRARATFFASAIFLGLLIGVVYGTYVVRSMYRPPLVPEPECQTIVPPSGEPVRFCAPPVERAN